MLVDGKKMAEEIKGELAGFFRDRSAVLAVILVGNEPTSVKFVERKKKFGEAIGVTVKVFEFEENITENDLAEEIEKMANDESINGLVIQLPLPHGFNVERILNSIPAIKDVDALTANASVDSPVVEAIMEIFNRHNVDLINKKILVVGQGKLVGRPLTIYLLQEGYDVEVADVKTIDLKKKTLSADVIISGVGKPSLITPEMIKNGVILIDAGTAEQAGKIKGDIDLACIDKSKLLTPVPGGVGPLVVAMLFKNLSKLIKNQFSG